MKAGNLLFLLNDDGELIVAKSSRTGIEPLKRYTVAESATWAQPTDLGRSHFREGRLDGRTLDTKLNPRAEYRVPSAWCVVPGAVPGAGCVVLGAVPGAGCRVPGASVLGAE